MAVRNVEYIITLRDKFSKPLASVDKNLIATGKRIQSIGKIMSLAVTLPIVALGATTVKLASDFEETESKFNTVFSSIQQQATRTAKNLKDNFGLSSRAALQLLGDTGDLLVGFGFTEKAALEMSRKVNELAVDLASFTNVQGGAQSASAALTKALLGERESIKTLGISILESDVKARVLLNTQKGLTFASVRQAKAVATLQLATEQSSKAIGDFERTSQSFANQLRISKARLEDLAISLGRILLPTALKLLKIVKEWVERFSALDASTKKTIIITAAFAAALGPVLFIIGKLIAILPILGAAITAAAGSAGLIIVGFAALVLVLIDLKNRTTLAERSQLRLNDALEKAEKKTIKQTEKLRNLIIILNSKSKADFVAKRALNELQRIFPEHFKNLDIEKAKLLDIELVLKRVALANKGRAILIERQRAQEKLQEIKGERLDPRGKFFTETEEKRLEKEREKRVRQQRGVIASLTLQARKTKDAIVRLSIQERIDTAKKDLTAITTAGAARQVGITKITSAAPKIFNINIDKLVETINNNVTTLDQGMNKSKDIITEAFLTMLADVQLQVR